MEDNNFWDELAKRLRQEQAQSFQEEDWATVHRRLRVQGKGRGAWFWPALIILAFLGNNGIWWLLWQQAEKGFEQPALSAQRDTVFVFQARGTRDTVWQVVAASPVFERASVPGHNSGFNGHTIPESPKTGDNAANSAIPTEQIAPPAPASAAHPADTTSRAAPRPDPLPLPFSCATFAGPQMVLVSATPASPTRPRRSPTLFLEADAGQAWFLPHGASGASMQQFGASVYVMPGKWGAVAGLRRLSATEDPAQTTATLGLPDACENCPAVGYPDRVRVHWMEFQLGLAYRLPLPGEKTSIHFSAMGRLRGRADQYQHFRFETYGGPPIDVEDRYRQKSGLYWNGWSGKISVIRRLKSRLGLYGSLEGQWPSGANPRLTPPSLGLNAGLGWYFRN